MLGYWITADRLSISGMIIWLARLHDHALTIFARSYTLQPGTVGNPVYFYQNL